MLSSEKLDKKYDPFTIGVLTASSIFFMGAFIGTDAITWVSQSKATWTEITSEIQSNNLTNTGSINTQDCQRPPTKEPDHSWFLVVAKAIAFTVASTLATRIPRRLKQEERNLLCKAGAWLGLLATATVLFSAGNCASSILTIRDVSQTYLDCIFTHGNSFNTSSSYAEILLRTNQTNPSNPFDLSFDLSIPATAGAITAGLIVFLVSTVDACLNCQQKNRYPYRHSLRKRMSILRQIRANSPKSKTPKAIITTAVSEDDQDPLDTPRSQSSYVSL